MLKHLRKPSLDEWPLIFLCGGLVGLLVLMVFASIAETEACQAKGGHIITKTSPGIGVAGNGGVAVTISSVSFCISADGRILY